MDASHSLIDEMQIKSRFRFTAWMSLSLFLLITMMMAVVVYGLLHNIDDFLPLTIGLFFVLLIWWLMLFELRKRACRVFISPEQIGASSIFGFVGKSSYALSEIDGFKTIIFPSKYGQYEYLFLMKDNARIMVISQYYHKNYAELKAVISRRLKFIGNEPFHFSKELAEFFK